MSKSGKIPEDYAPFFLPEIAKIPDEIVQTAIDNSISPEILPDIADMHLLEMQGYTAHENAKCQDSDGSLRLAIHTPMPGVTPQMWDWWFAWHGCEDNRYRLWHPKAHVSARWEDGRNDICYIGRNSIIKEYIGQNLLDALIQFKSPLDFGFSKAAVNQKDRAVYICARIGHPSLPVDYGYLVHQIRATTDGAEMRSRFWLGGKYAGLRAKNAWSEPLSQLLRKVKKLPENFGKDMILHCAEEMRHLAAFLPQLYRTFQQNTFAISGNIIQKTHSQFHQKLLADNFNKTDFGRIPAMIVEPHTVEDVIQTVHFAKCSGKRISITSGGHSFSANFMRSDAILLRMKNFNRFNINKDNMTATAGPGVGGSDLLKALYRQDLFFPAGHCKGVCIGGYLLQGGYGWNGRKLGIACQSILAMDIVTASGELVHASPHEHSALFWAARGAGPGFFGIVVQFHLRIYPLPPYRAVMAHHFSMQHLEHVYHWAYEQGPNIPQSVEFQILMSRNLMQFMGPGMEVFAPVFADTRDEFEASLDFIRNSPIKKLARLKTPAFNPGIEIFYRSAMTHYPENHHWAVDNMWTHSPIDELLPFLQQISRELPPAPSHLLWLNWYPEKLQEDMSYSMEDNLYLALYSCWKNPKDSDNYRRWTHDMMRKMEHLSTGIQLADEALHQRKSTFMSNNNYHKVNDIRKIYDPKNLFFEWHNTDQ